jgi:cytochrome c1
MGRNRFFGAHHGWPVTRPAMLLCWLSLLVGCRSTATANRRRAGAPDVERGRTLIAELGCGACHTIAGVDGANGLAGPPLSGEGRRTYIAGVLANTPENLQAWIRSPQSIKPGVAMPDLELRDEDAADIAAYIHSRY